MSRPQPKSPPNRLQTALDIGLIAALSFVAHATHFSYKQGQAVICGDSAQYVASAEALLDSERTPHFEMRKPGYAFFLAAIALVSGNMGWAALVANYVCLGLLPLAAYGWGRHLRSRPLGWIAAALTIAQPQTVFWGDRMLSESLFTVVLSFGLLALVVGLSKRRSRRWLALAGVLLGLAWFTRGSATPIIAVAGAAIIVAMWREPRRAVVSCACFAVPVLGFIALECGLNQSYSGRFRPANGTVGATLLLRARHFEGFEFPQSRDASRVLALLPERSEGDAYISSHLDVWMARYHAVHDLNLSEYEYDDLMRRVGVSMLLHNFGAYVRSSLRLTAHHLLRRPEGQDLSPVPTYRRTWPYIHPDAPADASSWVTNWPAYYGLPHMTRERSLELVDRMHHAAATRAPFGGSTVWRVLRYWSSKPVATATTAALTGLGTLWPGFALLLCFWLGLNRRTCIVLAAAYLADALFLGFLTPTTVRLQFIWIVTDTVLASSLVLGAGLAMRWCSSALRGQLIARRRPVGEVASPP